MADVSDTDYDKPVAYDSEGRPLYAHPPVQGDARAPAKAQIIHARRPVEPAWGKYTPEQIQQMHRESIEKYPQLNLSENEYVISAVYRHWIGLVSSVGVGVVVAILIVVAWIALPSIMPKGMVSIASLTLPAIALLVVVSIATYLAVWVYMNNRFFLTNESVIQEIQHSIFTKREQTVSLLNIEDTSFSQIGPIQYLFSYGSIRLSTEGDETTYRFEYVASPKDQVAKINNAVEAFKDGRPAED